MLELLGIALEIVLFVPFERCKRWWKRRVAKTPVSEGR
jgi:hypothetical protein